ncbi:hypothetical protein AJ80_01425 [Polytolypa hystricis UAMH7299]|uniref:Ribosome biogenesis protein NOP53 n=1 Tax=Polytolypa hystricis (strain UAMH7299) TaxID=1447883 RepID=A0A2B7YS38_POLH7|nr:hypothetical protein AJ80_01425 [Polytolypa hystricis UAMH7299]
MAAVTEAPQQYKQPSRKGKKAWRKNVDVSQVQEGLERVREEVIQGGVITEKSSEELFTLDTAGSETIKGQLAKSTKPLRSDEILAQRSAIPAVDNRKRPISLKVTDGIIEPKTKRQRSDWVTNKEWQRLKKVAQEGNPLTQGTNEITAYDPWGEDSLTPAPQSEEEPKFNFLPEKKAIVIPKTAKRPPISLAANGKPVPAVKNPDAGTSYNPSFEAWDKLLTEEGAKEVEAEKERLEEERLEKERLALIEAATNENDEAKSDDESAWEGFESEYEAPEWLKKKRPERKTKVQRNKIQRRKEAERKARWEAQMKKRAQQATEVKEIAQTVEENEARKQLQKVESSDEEGDDRVLRRRAFGKFPVPEKPLEVVLPDELQDSLRLLKPEGNLLGDRFHNLIVNGKLEARKPISQPKQAKRTYTEKWTYKDFKI